MKKSTGIIASAVFSTAMFLSAVSAPALDIGGILKAGTDGLGFDDILGDSDLGKVYQAYTLEFTDEDAYYIGRSAAAVMLKHYSFYEDPELESYMNKICGVLAENSDEQLPYNGYHLKILDTDEINAFSTPGGHIFVTRGMISCATSEDSLAAIIAHEMAHIQLQHGLEAIKDKRINESSANALGNLVSNLPGYKKTMNYINEISDSTKKMLSKAGFDESEISMGVDLNNLSSLVVDYFVNGYSKEAEFEADKRALKLMADAGYSPSEMITMLEKMDTVGEFKTHPKPEARIKEVKKNLKGMKVNDTTSFRKTRFMNIGKSSGKK